MKGNKERQHKVEELILTKSCRMDGMIKDIGAKFRL
uniref:Uncharacterized protein n=1 Tax=Anguilla anguilla TaxID=7936 RepID=A0A0E9VLZ1_ANGAN